jgi:hypothetical protein
MNQTIFPAFSRILWIASILVGFLIAYPQISALADTGPKPTADFTFVQMSNSPLTILSAKLLQCQDTSCSESKPLQDIGPQHFTCNADSCNSTAYGYAVYQRLEVTFSDGKTRLSNEFTKKSFAARYRVTIRPDDLLVEEQAGGFNPYVLLFLFGASGAIFLAALCIALLAILIFWILRARNNRTQQTPSIHLMISAWVIGLPLFVLGAGLTLALPLTIAVESVLAFAYSSLRGKPRLSLVTAVLLINLITLPALWFVLQSLNNSSLPFLALGEVLIWLFETVLLYLTQRSYLSFKESLILSLGLNGASFLAGLFFPV